jgi:hypothetical protein
MISKDNTVLLGNVYGKQFGTGYAGNVWDKEYYCPIIRTCQGEREPKVIIPIKIKDN